MATISRTPVWMLLLALPGLYLIVVFLCPLLYMLLFSVWQYSQIDVVVQVFTLENYRELLSSFYVGLFARTFRVGLVTTLTCAVLAFPVAYFIARSGPRVKAVAVFLIITPLMISTVVRVFGLSLILQRDGLLNQLITSLGLPALRLARTEAAVVIGLVQMLLPLMVLPLTGAIERIPVQVEEAARCLGATWFQVFTTTLFPLALPGLVSGSILVYTLSISALVIPALLGGPGDRMVGQQIYDQMLVAFNWPEASAISMALIAFTVLLAAVGFTLAGRASRSRGA